MLYRKVVQAEDADYGIPGAVFAKEEFQKRCKDDNNRKDENDRKEGYETEEKEDLLCSHSNLQDGKNKRQENKTGVRLVFGEKGEN